MVISNSLADDEIKQDIDSRDPDFEENESDSIAESDIQAFSQAIVTGTDWTTETILNQLRKGNIDIDPKFQRRDAWTRQRKSKFIESILLGIPVPQIILAERRDERGKFIVIDGKQRLLALRQFIAKPDEEFNQIKLAGLEFFKELNGVTYSELETNPEYYRELNAFQNYSIRTAVIKNWPSSAYLHVIFLRLNTGSVQLSPQELRLALLPGKFMDFVDEFASNSEEIRQILNISKPDRRMRDVEYAIRFFAYKYQIENYTGNLKVFLDSTCENLNRRWKTEENDIKEKAASLNRAIRVTFKIFGDKNAFKKWAGTDYESRNNRAVFDIMAYYFSEPAIANAAEPESDRIEQAFKNLCEKNIPFLRSLETSTKNVVPTQTRFREWGEALRDILGDVVNYIPTIDAVEDKKV